MESSLNIVLFGEAGVGKSSVINLIAEKDVAPTSADSWGCTFESKRYTFPVAKRSFNVWDTIGLGEPLFSVTGYLGAIEKTFSLIQQIQTEGGLDLLLFCIPGGLRISQTMQCNYRLFYSALCEKQIPIALVVTRLEGEAEMDDWWTRNAQHIRRCGLIFSGHACVTGLKGDQKAAKGRSALQLLLLNYDHKGRYVMPPASDWYLGFLKRLSIVSRPRKMKDKRKELERLLRDRCMIHAPLARRLAEDLTRDSSQGY